jgi:hypothetical protein
MSSGAKRKTIIFDRAQQMGRALSSSLPFVSLPSSFSLFFLTFVSIFPSAVDGGDVRVSAIPCRERHADLRGASWCRRKEYASASRLTA